MDKIYIRYDFKKFLFLLLIKIFYLLFFIFQNVLKYLKYFHMSFNFYIKLRSLYYYNNLYYYIIMIILNLSILTKIMKMK